MNEELERAMVAASGALKKCLPTGQGGTKNENVYEAAYQELVKAGARPQLRAKYRSN